MFALFSDHSQEKKIKKSFLGKLTKSGSKQLEHNKSLILTYIYITGPSSSSDSFWVQTICYYSPIYIFFFLKSIRFGPLTLEIYNTKASSKILQLSILQGSGGKHRQIF